MLSRIALVSAAPAIALCACATSTRVDFGGVLNPAAVPADAVACADSAWEPGERVAPVYPQAMSRFFYAAQSEYSLQALQFAFDIDETGSTRNIRLVEPLAYTRHATMREAILVSAEAIAQWRYDAEGEARYATGCATQMNFIYEDTPEPS